MDNILIEDRGWYKLMYNPNKLYVYIEIEYNIPKSAELLNIKDENVR